MFVHCLFAREVFILWGTEWPPTLRFWNPIWLLLCLVSSVRDFSKFMHSYLSLLCLTKCLSSSSFFNRLLHVMFMHCLFIREVFMFHVCASFWLLETECSSALCLWNPIWPILCLTSKSHIKLEYCLLVSETFMSLPFCKHPIKEVLQDCRSGCGCTICLFQSILHLGPNRKIPMNFQCLFMFL